MPQLGFQAWKAPRVESGELRTTIRNEWKRPIRVGDTLKMFQGLRTKLCRSLGWATCTCAEPVRVVARLQRDRIGHWWIDVHAWVAGRKLALRDIAGLAVADGFDDIVGLLEWLRKNKRGALRGDRLEYRGVLIKWGPMRRAEKGT
jgi:hypothetical protein